MLCTYFLWPGSRVLAQLLRPITAGYRGSGAYSINQSDVFSFTINQASLAQLKYPSAGIHGERKFLIKELNLYHIVVGLPTRSGNFGLKGIYYGFSDYNQSQIGLAYARKLGSKIDIGLQFDYTSIGITGYGNATGINFELGTVFHLTGKLHTGLHAYNPVGGKIGKGQKEKLASVYTFGMGYDASDLFFVSAEVEKEEAQPININIGLQYKFLPRFLSTVGIGTSTSTAFIGFGLEWNNLRCHITTSYHPQLGITPGLLLMYTRQPAREG